MALTRTRIAEVLSLLNTAGAVAEVDTKKEKVGKLYVFVPAKDSSEYDEYAFSPALAYALMRKKLIQVNSASHAITKRARVGVTKEGHNLVAAHAAGLSRPGGGASAVHDALKEMNAGTRLFYHRQTQMWYLSGGVTIAPKGVAPKVGARLVDEDFVTQTGRGPTEDIFEITATGRMFMNGAATAPVSVSTSTEVHRMPKLTPKLPTARKAETVTAADLHRILTANPKNDYLYSQR